MEDWYWSGIEGANDNNWIEGDRNCIGGADDQILLNVIYKKNNLDTADAWNCKDDVDKHWFQ